MITPSFGLTATERVLPKLALDFTTASLDNRITFTRALNTATRVNSSGNVEVVNANIPRFDYNPTTLTCKGLLIEESRINSIKNNTSQGAVSGTPGTLPTNWQKSEVGSMAFAVVGTGTDSGIEYIDIRYYGTASSGSGSTIQFTQNTEISASTGQSWSFSMYLKIVGGSTSGFNGLNIGWEERTNSSYVTSHDSSVSVNSTGALPTKRYSYSTANTGGATVTCVKPVLYFYPYSGQTVDVTVRIGLPQMELGAFATSVIKTTSAAVTRNADVATMTGTNFSDWWTATNGASDIWLIPKSTSTLAYMSFDDNTANNKIVLANSTTSGQSTITSGGVLQATLTAGTITANATNKIGCSWNTNNCAATANATTPATTVSATIPTVTQLRIGSSGSAYANAWVQKLFYWPQRITNNEIQAFTK